MRVGKREIQRSKLPPSDRKWQRNFLFIWMIYETKCKRKKKRYKQLTRLKYIHTIITYKHRTAHSEQWSDASDGMHFALITCLMNHLWNINSPHAACIRIYAAHMNVNMQATWWIAPMRDSVSSVNRNEEKNKESKKKQQSNRVGVQNQQIRCGVLLS